MILKKKCPIITTISLVLIYKATSQEDKPTEFDEQVRLDRLLDFEIRGIPVIENEDCWNYIDKIGRYIGLPNVDVELVSCYRTKAKIFTSNSNIIPPIVAKGLDKSSKIRWLTAFRISGPVTFGNIGITGPEFANWDPNTLIYIKDRLSGRNDRLLRIAKRLREVYHYKDVYSRNGYVYLKTGSMFNYKLFRIDSEKTLKILDYKHKFYPAR